jgi:hypothetical protein
MAVSDNATYRDVCVTLPAQIRDPGLEGQGLPQGGA